MKKVIFVAASAIVVLGIAACGCSKKQNPNVDMTGIDIHNSRNSLDWNGVYAGTVPCADCPGIDLDLTLNTNDTYSMTVNYQDRKGTLSYSGEVKWDQTGSKIDLQNVNGDGAFQHFIVQENSLLLLTPSGEIISGSSTGNYTLAKIADSDTLPAGLVNQYWKLVELMGKPVTSEAFIFFKRDGKVHGNFGCNSFNGAYTLQAGNRVHFSELVNTLKMCLDMTVEDEFKKVLNTADNYNITDSGQLVLNRARMAPLARFEVVSI